MALLNLPYRLRAQSVLPSGPFYQGRMFPDDSMLTANAWTKKAGREEMMKSKYASTERKKLIPRSPSSLSRAEKIRRRVRTEGFYSAKLAEHATKHPPKRCMKRSSTENLLLESDLPVPATKKGRNDTDYSFGIETADPANSAPLISLALCVEQAHVSRRDLPSDSSNASRIEEIISLLQKFHLGKASRKWLMQMRSDDTASTTCAVRSTEYVSPAEEKRKDDAQASSVPKARKSVRFAEDVQVIAIESIKYLQKKVTRRCRAKTEDSEVKGASGKLDADSNSLGQKIDPDASEMLVTVNHSPQASSRLLSRKISSSGSDKHLLSIPIDHLHSYPSETAKETAVENDRSFVDPVWAGQQPGRYESIFNNRQNKSRPVTSENHDNVVRSRAARDRTCVTAPVKSRVTSIRDPVYWFANFADGGNHGSRARVAPQSSSGARLRYDHEKHSVTNDLGRSSNAPKQAPTLGSAQVTEALASHDVSSGDEQAEHTSNVDTAAAQHPRPAYESIPSQTYGIARSQSSSSTSASAPDDSRAGDIETSFSQSKPKARFCDAQSHVIEAALNEEHKSLSYVDEFEVKVPGAFDTTAIETMAKCVEPPISSKLGLMERIWTALSKLVCFGSYDGFLT
ncbi:uncharacterized protein AB675_9239 [Cyphellophora attinorum]|uniref:Uncharacterized protein n=1 Tax=Cyphellophora attinorum TaxID=1664694 RepID=A0A0N0NND7_9EURO|nr:uncharacterized protein AB675_9239 [Phialophora attinorum]KPI41408.1 hypothetical protein AB675_9239 [Phialophora attinorum]